MPRTATSRPSTNGHATAASAVIDRSALAPGESLEVAPGVDSKHAVVIAAPKFRTVAFRIRGTTPLVQNKFSAKALQQMHATQAAGSTARSKRTRTARDFDGMYRDAMHISSDGWHGLQANAFRTALVDACRTVGFAMTKAKLAVFIEPDGFDATEDTPLVRITKTAKEPTAAELKEHPCACTNPGHNACPGYFESMGRNETGVVDLRVRPKWAAGWEAIVKVRFDADMFSESDVANLMLRVGQQVGIGEGRPNSKNSTGQGWGMYALVNDQGDIVL